MIFPFLFYIYLQWQRMKGVAKLIVVGSVSPPLCIVAKCPGLPDFAQHCPGIQLDCTNGGVAQNQYIIEF